MGAVKAYLDAATDEVRDQCFAAIQEWLAVEYERDGYSAEAVDRMDLVSNAHQLIERERQARR